MQQNYNVIKNEMLKIQNIESVATSLSLPNGNARAASGVTWEGKSEDNNIFFKLLIPFGQVANFLYICTCLSLKNTQKISKSS